MIGFRFQKPISSAAFASSRERNAPRCSAPRPGRSPAISVSEIRLVFSPANCLAAQVDPVHARAVAPRVVGSLAALQVAAPLDCRVSEAVSPEVRQAARPFPVLLRSVEACEDEPCGSTHSRLIGASAIVRRSKSKDFGSTGTWVAIG